MTTLPTYVVTDRPGTATSDRLLVLLHGYGATEHDLAAVGPLLDPAARFLVAGVRGPVEVPGAGHAWFRPTPLGPEPESFHHALDALHRTIDRLCGDHLMARDEVVVGGFSQGAAMALAVGLGDGPRARPAGILCLSGFLADVAGLTYDWAAAAATQVLVQHGTHDETVPVDLGRDTASVLELHGVPVRYEEYPIAHQVTLESLAGARAWLATIHDGPPAPTR